MDYVVLARCALSGPFIFLLLALAREPAHVRLDLRLLEDQRRVDRPKPLLEPLPHSRLGQPHRLIEALNQQLALLRREARRLPL